MTRLDMQSAYDRSAGAWAAGPEQVYARLAQRLVDDTPVPLAGARVLDLGAGTGVAGRASLAGGAALVVGVDVAIGMLRRGAASIRPIVADARALPFRADSFDLVVAAFSLGHVPEPLAALLETCRVGGALLVSAFATDWTHPAKAAVDEVLARFGFRPPPWYEALKNESEPQVDDPENLGALALAAGYLVASVHTVPVATGLDTPAQLAGWRLGMAHIAPFLQALDPTEQAAVRSAAEYTLAGAPPLVVQMVMLAAT